MRKVTQGQRRSGRKKSPLPRLCHRISGPWSGPWKKESIATGRRFFGRPGSSGQIVTKTPCTGRGLRRRRRTAGHPQSPTPTRQEKIGGTQAQGTQLVVDRGALCSGTGGIVPAGGRRWAGNQNGRKPKGQLDHLPASAGIYPRRNARNTRLQRTTVGQWFTDLYAESSKLSDVNDLDCPPSRSLIKSHGCRSDV